MAREPVLYPRIYPWYVVLATLDVLLTWLILTSFHGIELNPIAAGVIHSGGMPAATFYKFATVMFVLWSCEYIGRRRLLAGRRLAFYAVVANCVPVTASMAQIAIAGHS
ncbi:MAG: hypothetical protein JNK58_07910 [Phycisphaerae bacterium]|nr:hypothetical protein [Phycisphaerae bacterium]